MWQSMSSCKRVLVHSCCYMCCMYAVVSMWNTVYSCIVIYLYYSCKHFPPPLHVHEEESHSHSDTLFLLSLKVQWKAVVDWWAVNGNRCPGLHTEGTPGEEQQKAYCSINKETVSEWLSTLDLTPRERGGGEEAVGRERKSCRNDQTSSERHLVAPEYSHVGLGCRQAPVGLQSPSSPLWWWSHVIDSIQAPWLPQNSVNGFFLASFPFSFCFSPP